MVVGHRSVVIVVTSGTQTEVGALIAERRFGVHLDQSAHGVAPVEGPLRAAQHVDAFDVGVVEVERRFVDIRYVVHIQPHGRCVDA